MSEIKIVEASAPSWVARFASESDLIDIVPVIARAVRVDLDERWHELEHGGGTEIDVLPIPADGHLGFSWEAPSVEIYALTEPALAVAVVELCESLLMVELSKLGKLGIRWGSQRPGIVPTTTDVLERADGEGWIGASKLDQGEWILEHADSLIARIAEVKAGNVLDQLTPVARSMVTSVEGSAASERAGRRDTAG